MGNLVGFFPNSFEKQLENMEKDPNFIRFLKQQFPSENMVIVCSGAGYIERFHVKLIHMMTEQNACSNVIVVNLSVNDNDKFYKKPDYDSVENLLKERPEVVGNYDLLLLLPESHDIASIEKLSPTTVNMLYEMFEDDANSDLFNWIKASCATKAIDLINCQDEVQTDSSTGYFITEIQPSQLSLCCQTKKPIMQARFNREIDSRKIYLHKAQYLEQSALYGVFKD